MSAQGCSQTSALACCISVSQVSRSAGEGETNREEGGSGFGLYTAAARGGEEHSQTERLKVAERPEGLVEELCFKLYYHHHHHHQSLHATAWTDQGVRVPDAMEISFIISSERESKNIP